MVRCHVGEPDKGRTWFALFGNSHGEVEGQHFTRQNKMAHELLLSLLVNQKRTLKSSGFLFQHIVTR